MAKAAKSVSVDVTETMVSKFVNDIMERQERIESARGTYMNAARREREAMTTIYEGLAARGVSQKAAKTEIKILNALEKIKGWVSDLELEDRKMVERLAKVQNDKKQLMLFDDLDPVEEGAPAADKPVKAKPVKAKAAKPGKAKLTVVETLDDDTETAGAA